MVQKTFGIYGDIAEKSRLFVEVGKHHVACWSVSDTESLVNNFELFEFELEKVTDFNEAFKRVGLMSKLFDLTFAGTHIIWDNEECLIVPQKYYNEDYSQDYLNRIFGSRIKMEVCEYSVNNEAVLFRLPDGWKEATLKQFPVASGIHKYQTLYSIGGNQEDGVSTTYLRVFFYRHHFVLVMVCHGQLQLLQSFDYETPEDAVYHILNSCERNNVQVDDVPVLVSGMIDVKSFMYEELYKYVRNIKPDSLDAAKLAPQFSNFPNHYFSPFLKMVV